MRIVSWNVGHQTQERRLKPVFFPAMDALSPDVVVLNEYVDGRTRQEMKRELARRGLCYIHTSSRIARHNQVLIAARVPLDPGSIMANALDDTARSNFLSVAVTSPEIDVVGFRAPAYETKKDTLAFWRSMDAIIRGSQSRSVIFIGDMNADPTDSRSPGGAVLASLRTDGWQVPHVEGEWSFARKDARTRIDHAVLSPSVTMLAATYATNIGDVECAGPSAGLYDHAPLVLDVETRLSANS